MKDTLKKLVTQVLSEHELARNNDNFLVCEVWARMRVGLEIGFGHWSTGANTVSSGDVSVLSAVSPESVIRIRAEIQNTDGFLLPTDPAVLVRRKVREEKIHAYYADRPKLVEEWKKLKYEVN